MSLILFRKIRKKETLLENTNPSVGEIAAINRLVCERKSGLHLDSVNQMSSLMRTCTYVFCGTELSEDLR